MHRIRRKSETRFIFDLDGTLTKVETLPLIARAFHVEGEIAEITRATLEGEIPFEQSMTRRVKLLLPIPCESIAELLENVPLYERVVSFMQAHRGDCVVATGNLDCWIYSLADRIGCKAFSSHAAVSNGYIAFLRSTLEKKDVVRHFQRQRYRVIFIGDGANDAEAMRQADLSIAAGMTHEPAPSVLDVADYRADDEAQLCQLLNRLCE